MKLVDFKKKNCWVIVCKKCGELIEEEGYYVPHFDTRKEAVEHIGDEGGENCIELTCKCNEKGEVKKK